MKRTVFLCAFFCFTCFFSEILYANPYDVKGDINGDKKINLQEAIYALQVTSGIHIDNVGNASETEPNDSLNGANPIGIGYSNPITNATISSVDDVDYYKFTPNANSTYVIETYDILANTSNQATGIYLYDANGVELANDKSGDNGTNNVNASITHTFSVTGTYYISVLKDHYINSWTGYYSLRILPKHDESGAEWNSNSEPNDKRVLANEIKVGLNNSETHQLDPKSSSYVNSGSDRDWHHFHAEAGRTYVIETFNIISNASNNATGIYLYDSSGIELSNDRSGQYGSNNANARIVYTFPITGIYYILVLEDHYDDWAGTYSLRILPRHDEPGASWDATNDYEPNDALVLANHIDIGPNQSQTHLLDPKSSDYVTSRPDHDWYYFNAESAGTYVIETFDTQADDATGIYLYDENKIELANDRSGNNGTNNVNAKITHTISRAGNYYILVKQDHYNDWAGTYSLRILKQ